MRGNASTLDFNSNEIVAEGESAGANLAALLGVYSTASQGDGSFLRRSRPSSRFRRRPI